MKKSLITLSVTLTVICCTLAFAASRQSLLPIPNWLGMSTTDEANASDVNAPGKKDKGATDFNKKIKKGLSVDKTSLELAMSRVQDINKSGSNKFKANGSGQQEIVVDVWGTAAQIYTFGEEDLYNTEDNTFTFTGSNEQTNHFFTGATSEMNYAWLAASGQTYTFSGKLSSDGAATVYPCILYVNSNDNKLYIKNNTTVVLDESNGFSAEFSFTAFGIKESLPLEVGYIVEGCNTATTTTITASEQKFFYSYTTSVAEKWTSDNNLPGLGVEEYNQDQSYIVECEDGVTTLGLYYNGELYVTGINTTASEVTLPKNITIEGNVMQINYFGLDGNIDWSAAQSVKTLHLQTPMNIIADFTNSAITDIYADSNCSFWNTSSTSEIYLHISYSDNRGNYDSSAFKRILVGEETPDYPIAEYSDWVIAGEEEGVYFGISTSNSTYSIAEIFTDKESVVLPIGTPAAGGNYYIRSFGADNYYGYGTLCKNAKNLKSVTIPASYTRFYVSWNSNPITDLHMQGDIPSTDWSLPEKMSVYVADQAYFSNYESNSNWNSASILPDGWDFEWMTVDVKRKGEFAQTYIEMTDADWSLGAYVKVTGNLNATDLGNIKNLTSLRKLDLSEAVFDELPSSFLESKKSLIEVTLPENISAIPSYAFRYCSRLSKVTAPGVNSIDDRAFHDCNKLTDFDISNVTTIGNQAFYNCNVFCPSELSPELRSLGTYAFYNTAIREILIPSTLKSISSSAFSNCKLLTKVTLPETLKAIGSSAFSNCTELVDINLPEGITTIESSAFSSCGKLTEITLPSTLQTLSSGVFSYCTALVSVKCKAIVPPTTDGEFTYNIDLNHCTLYIAPFAIDAYRDAQYWNAFYIMKPLNEPVKNIYVNRPMTFDLQSEDNAVLQENPNMTLDYKYESRYNTSVGQLSASGDGTLSAGIFSINHNFLRRSTSFDYRTTLVNNAENMRADSVLCSIKFEKNYWHFISFQYDVEMEDIFGLNNTDFVIRQYNSANRATGDGTTSNWEDVPENGTLKAGKGYIIQAANNSKNASGSTYDAVVCFPSRNTVTKNNLFTSNNIIVPLEEYPAEFAHNRSWNLVGNPYPCYYDMHCLMEDFTTPIVLWRGSSYQAYSPVDDDIILRPNEAFFVQRPLDAENMVFGAEGRMHYTAAMNAKDANGNNVTPGAKAPAMTINNSNRSVFNFTISGCGSDDRARIVMNENAKMDYEIDKDASKFFAEVSNGAEIYVDGNVKYDICERPLENGNATLGTRIGTSGEYTISLAGRNIEDWTVILTDTETGASVNLCENSYSFSADMGTTAGRFVLTFKAPETNAINGAEISDSDKVQVINTAGVVVFEGNINDFKATAQPGIYVVVAKEQATKIVVK